MVGNFITNGLDFDEYEYYISQMNASRKKEEDET
jgi:hypothetical protein